MNTDTYQIASHLRLLNALERWTGALRSHEERCRNCGCREREHYDERCQLVEHSQEAL